MTREDIKTQIKEYIAKNDYISYMELQRLLSDIGYDYQGDLWIVSPMCEHVVFWMGWNADAIALINELQEDGSIHKEPTQFLTYLIDGGGLNLPIVKSGFNYKKDHWLPVVFCRGKEVKRR